MYLAREQNGERKKSDSGEKKRGEKREESEKNEFEMGSILSLPLPGCRLLDILRWNATANVLWFRRNNSIIFNS
jgi:hypothetical protein